MVFLLSRKAQNENELELFNLNNGPFQGSGSITFQKFLVILEPVPVSVNGTSEKSYRTYGTRAWHLLCELWQTSVTAVQADHPRGVKMT